MQEQPRASSRGEAVFTETDYATNPSKVIAHAVATGRAVVVRSDGRPRIVISTPTSDLPMLDDE